MIGYYHIKFGNVVDSKLVLVIQNYLNIIYSEKFNLFLRSSNKLNILGRRVKKEIIQSLLILSLYFLLQMILINTVKYFFPGLNIKILSSTFY